MAESLYNQMRSKAKISGDLPLFIGYAEAVTPNDGTDIDECYGLYIGSGGNVTVTFSSGHTATFANYPGGTYIPAPITRVWDTGTSASDILAIYY